MPRCGCFPRKSLVSGEKSCGELGQQNFTVLPKTLLQADKSSPTSPRKVHVVWKVNMKLVQDWLAGRAAAPEMGLEGEAEPDADLEVALETGAQAPRRSSVSHPHTKAKKEHVLFPAYSTGDRVEYFSTTQEKWLFGEVQVQTRGKALKGPLYSVTLHRLAQELPHVGQEMLRLPFAAGEPCELWSSIEKCWLMAEVLAMEAGSTPLRQYKVQLTDEPFIVEASMLRRCFPEGSQVRVYQGPTQGFCHARVTGPSEPLASGDGLYPQTSTFFTSDQLGSRDYHVMVPILKESRESAMVPSYLLRFVPQHFQREGGTAGFKKPLKVKRK